MRRRKVMKAGEHEHASSETAEFTVGNVRRKSLAWFCVCACVRARMRSGPATRRTGTTT